MKIIIASCSSAFRNAFSIKGRSPRREYWPFVLVVFVGVQLLFQLDLVLNWTYAAGGFGYISTAFLLLFLVPIITSTIRRLHDTGMSGAWLLLYFVIPVLGALAVLILCCRRTQQRDNAFGPGPSLALEPPSSDGGTPHALQDGSKVKCPWCMKTNPPGREDCQWCHKPYRDPTPEAPAAEAPAHA